MAPRRRDESDREHVGPQAWSRPRASAVPAARRPSALSTLRQMKRRVLVVLTVLALTVAAAGCDWRTIDPPGAVPLRYRDKIFGTVVKTSDIEYGTATNLSHQSITLTLDMYEPKNDTVTKRPVIVWVHGGSFSSGDKTSPELVDEANTFSKKGYVNVSINYRLSATGCSAAAPTSSCILAIQNSMHDAQAAVRFLRANASTYGVDPDRIAIGGTSAGAITALDVGYNPDDPGTSGNPGFSSAVGA